MGKQVEFGISLMDFDPDAAAKLKAAREAVAKIESSIVEAYTKSDRFKAAVDLAGTNDYGRKYSPTVQIQNYKIVSSVPVDEAVDAKALQTRPTLYLAEKTVNMLLSGKLLNDEQKKALLKQVGFDVDALETPTA